MDSVRALVSHWGYLAVFGCVMLGNIGIPVPEESVLWVAGFLVWRGRLELPLVLLVGIVAAVAGDNLGYWLGRRYGQPTVERCANWARVPTARLKRMQRFVARYGPVGVFCARFIAGLRFLAGPLAGSLGLRPLPFFLANVLGALCYVPIMVGTGYAVGYGFRQYVRGFLRTERRLERGLLLAGLLVGLLCLVYRALLRHRRDTGD